MKYLIVLGTQTALCEAEFGQVLRSSQISFSSRMIFAPVVLVDTNQELDPEGLIQKLGGTIKIGRVIGAINEISADHLLPFIASIKKDRLTFGLSVYSRISIQLYQLLATIKSELAPKYEKIRYILPQQDLTLSSVVIKKQSVIDFILVFDIQIKKWLVGQVESVQDVDEWAKRDFGRPFADPKAGMLPPKAARMMVNLSSQFRPRDDQPLVDAVSSSLKNKVLLDPFCGMGTILAEALLLGWQVIGSDYSHVSIKKASKNLDWLVSMYRYIEIRKFGLLEIDATRISQKVEKNTVDAIVTEPFLGAPFEEKGQKLYQKHKLVTKETVANTIKGLEKLYIGAMRDWLGVLKSNGKVVIAFPEIYFEGRRFTVKNLIDTCEKLGYTLSEGPYEYSRPQAIVKRQIYIFKKL